MLSFLYRQPLALIRLVRLGVLLKALMARRGEGMESIVYKFALQNIARDVSSEGRKVLGGVGTGNMKSNACGF